MSAPPRHAVRAARAVRARRRAFTLLEVFIAIAILGLALSIVLSAQGGLFASARRVHKLSFATQLVRCKMAEVEQKLVKEGYPLTDQNDSGSCCENDSDSAFSCEWKVERVELPQPAGFGSASPNGSGAPPSSATPFGSAFSGPGSTNSLNPSGPLDALSQLRGGNLQGGTGTSGLAGTMAAAGGQDAIASMALGMVYPSLKPMLEASIRKVTVTVLWHEGDRDQKLSVVQFVTNPQQGNLDPNAALTAGVMADQLGGALGIGAGGAGGGARPPTGGTR